MANPIQRETPRKHVKKRPEDWPTAICLTCPTTIIVYGVRRYCRECARLRALSQWKARDRTREVSERRREQWRLSKQRQRAHPHGPPLADAIVAKIDKDLADKLAETHGTHLVRCGTCAQLSIGVVCARCGAPR